MFSLGLQKEFSKRTSLGLNIFQPFNRTLSFPTELEGPSFYQKSVRETVIRSFGINFRHRRWRVHPKIDEMDFGIASGGEQVAAGC